MCCSLLLFISGCGSSLITEKDLSGAPEARLYYPGAKVISRTGSDERSTLTGDYPAELGVVLQVNATSNEIYLWYSRQLHERGWTLGKTESVNGNYQIYTKGDRFIFQVGPAGTQGLYSIHYSVVPEACATTPPTRVAFAKCG
jgi:hypothetical protein